jgi:hypothetical protein
MTRSAQIVQEVTVVIGQTPILLRCQDDGFWEIVEQRADGFVSDGASPVCSFDVVVVRPERSLSSVRELLVRKDGDNWRLERETSAWSGTANWSRAHPADRDALRDRYGAASFTPLSRRPVGAFSCTVLAPFGMDAHSCSREFQARGRLRFRGSPQTTPFS